ncbi:MAG: hypothetical protein RL336_2038 [Pseudomonadota bacterium]
MINNFNSAGTILLVDDIEENIRTALGILDDYDVIPCTSGREAIEILGEENIDLILLDIMMPEMNGFQVCEEIKANPTWQEIPIIFLTARQDEDSIEKAYDVGAHDYITKPFLPRELRARVDFQLKYFNSLKKLEYFASHDPMTGLYNRRRFFEIAKCMFERQSPANFFAIMLDIDHFKRINDQYGHATGDNALKAITAAISNILPGDTCFARLGGEEFAIVMGNSNTEHVNALAEHIRQIVEETPIAVDEKTIHCSVSLGVCQNDVAYNNIDALLQAADQALYEAKDSGRNRSIFRGSH